VAQLLPGHALWRSALAKRLLKSAVVLRPGTMKYNVEEVDFFNDMGPDFNTRHCGSCNN
jgi:hypothetical protein